MKLYCRNPIALTDVTFHVCNSEAVCYSVGLPSAGNSSNPLLISRLTSHAVRSHTFVEGSHTFVQRPVASWPAPATFRQKTEPGYGATALCLRSSVTERRNIAATSRARYRYKACGRKMGNGRMDVRSGQETGEARKCLSATG